MTRGFWDKIDRPYFLMAPMADVTDSAFHQAIAKRGKPSAFYTEFVSCDGLQSVGRERLLHDLNFTEIERPIVAQIFGSRPENFFKTAQLLRELGFDGVDINMGCPEKNVNKQGACAELIRQPELAKEIIQATKDGAAGLPVTVKTRIGYHSSDLENWTKHLLETRPVAITFHWRTKKEESKVPAHWELANIPVAMAKGTDVMIFGNGDVESLADAKQKIQQYGVDGVMLGRAIFGNPWLFSEHLPTVEEKLEALVEHTRLYEELYQGVKSFAIMKKHFKAYVSGFDGASALREKLMQTETADEVENIIRDCLKK